MTVSTRTRRLGGLIAGLVSASLLLTACSSSETPEETPASPADAGSYPVTVDTTYGEITLEEKPERIVVIGADFVDMLAALGESPVAFAGAGEQDEDTLLQRSPWLADLNISGFDPALVTAEYKADPEAIAVHEPDLIIGTPYYIEQQQLDQLSSIAPTYVTIFASDRDWTDNLTDLGALIGNSEGAEQAISEVEDQFSVARDQLAGLQGATFNLGWYTGDSPRLPPAYGWVEDLGLVHAESQPGPGDQAVNLSGENLEQVSGDVALIQADEAGQAALKADPRFAELPSVKNEAQFFVDRSVIDAGLFAGPVSMSWLLEQVVPLLAGSPLNSDG